MLASLYFFAGFSFYENCIHYNSVPHLREKSIMTFQLMYSAVTIFAVKDETGKVENQK